MGKDWDAVAAAINGRLAELDMTQQDLAARSGVSVATLRQLQRNYAPRRRSPRTLAAISEGLGWPAGHLDSVLQGQGSGGSQSDSLREEVTSLRGEVDDLRARVIALEEDR